jgi:hypothetical protein
VSRVDGADQSFTADLFILLRWHDPRLEGVFEATDRVPLDSVLRIVFFSPRCCRVCPT